ncbi:hypothetical protein [Capnocytophaga periodontitidis]|uniref:hypothetical protein n=1 Tax=Capnocytophaga periodontitidis TaxID=2795027 RepID=UPI0018E1D4A5|nr:hypothetical protein [Capnocytophaga periodontitidis]MBI1668180.1 hypothetical protein [Capnocytophaga periodontitidis]
MTTIIDIGNLLDTCKDEYFLVEESTGNIYYQYKEEKKVFINSDKDSFNKCLFAYSNFVKNNNSTLVTAENIINICKKHIQYTDFIIQTDFLGAKSFFWQEKLYDIAILIEDNHSILSPYNDFFLFYETKMYINSSIAEINTYQEYQNIDKESVIRTIQTIYNDLSIENLHTIQLKVMELVLVPLYGKARFDDFLLRREKRIKEIMGI